MRTKTPSRPVVLLDAPSNLGLSPPEEGSVPGCYKLGWALREAGLVDGLAVEEAGVVIPPRYEAKWVPGAGDRNAEAIADFSTSVADRLVPLIEQESFVVVLGGDCSVLVGVALGMARLGRFGLVFLDGHSDFRHLSNADEIGAVAGEDLAIVTGRGDERLVSLEGVGPYIRDEDVAAVGMRDNDLYLAELENLGIPVWSMNRLREVGIEKVVEAVISGLCSSRTEGFWVHLDVDILDPEVMPAVDTPDRDGLQYEELSKLLAAMTAHPRAIGMDVCIFDPDLDPHGVYAKGVASALRPVIENLSD